MYCDAVIEFLIDLYIVATAFSETNRCYTSLVVPLNAHLAVSNLLPMKIGIKTDLIAWDMVDGFSML